MLVESGVTFKTYHKKYGPETIEEAFKEAIDKTRFPYLVAIGGINENPILAATAWTQVSSIVPDGCVFFTREAIQSVGYFNENLSGQAQMMEYLARINKQAGFIPEYFLVLSNCQRYIETFKSNTSSKEDWKFYRKCLKDIEKGEGLFKRR